MPNKLIRNFITGEWEEVPFTGSGVIARIPAPGGTARNVSGCWPLISEAAAVNPADIRREQQALKRKGVTTEFTPDGRPIFTSRAHRKAHCEAVGLYDRNGGSGDPQPRNFVASDYTEQAMRQAIDRMYEEYD